MSTEAITKKSVGEKHPFALAACGSAVMFSVTWLANDWPVSVFLLFPRVLLHETVFHRVAEVVSLACPAALFFVWWLPAAVSVRSRMPIRTTVLLWICVALSAAWFLSMGRDGAMVQGMGYVTFLAAVETACLVCLLLLKRWAKKRDSVGSSFLFHLAFFAWLTGLAFPWLGEGF